MIGKLWSSAGRWVFITATIWLLLIDPGNEENQGSQQVSSMLWGWGFRYHVAAERLAVSIPLALGIAYRWNQTCSWVHELAKTLQSQGLIRFEFFQIIWIADNDEMQFVGFQEPPGQGIDLFKCKGVHHVVAVLYIGCGN